MSDHLATSDVTSQITFKNTDKFTNFQSRTKIFKSGNIVIANIVLQVMAELDADTHYEIFSVPSAIYPKQPAWVGWACAITNISTGAMSSNNAYITYNNGSFYAHCLQALQRGSLAFMTTIMWNV